MAISAGNHQRAVLYMIAYSAGLGLILAMSIFVNSLLEDCADGASGWLGRINAALLVLLGTILIAGIL